MCIKARVHTILCETPLLLMIPYTALELQVTTILADKTVTTEFCYFKVLLII
jgi:hypothetical protein